MLKKKCEHKNIRIMAYYKTGTASKAKCNDCGEYLVAEPVNIKWKKLDLTIK